MIILLFFIYLKEDSSLLANIFILIIPSRIPPFCSRLLVDAVRQNKSKIYHKTNADTTYYNYIIWYPPVHQKTTKDCLPVCLYICQR